MTIKNNKVAENFISLLFVQGVNYILPLITIPYLVRVLGLSGFGLYTFVYAVMQYFIYLTDYGFNLSASRKASISRDNPKELSRLFSTVVCIKFILFIASVACVTLLSLLVAKFKPNYEIFMISLISVFGNFIFPVWYYIGIEKTKYMAACNFVAKLLSTAAIFVFVKNQQHLPLAVFLQSMGVVLAGVLSLLVLFVKWPVKIIVPPTESIKKEFKDGWNVFITLMASTLVNNTNIFLLGMLTNNIAVGYYSVADKIIRAFINLCSPVSIAIFPRVSKLFDESKATGIIYLRKVMLWGTAGFGICVLTLLLGTDILVKIVAGERSDHISFLIRIMAFLPLSIFWDNLFGTQILINLGKTAEFMKAVLIPGILSVVVSLVLVPIYKETATAFIFVLSEIAILAMMVYYTRKNRIYLVKDGLF